MRPDRILVINRARDTDRLADFDRRFSAAAPGATYEVVTAADRPDLPALGLYQSHLTALRSGPGPVLILEDDAVFADGFTLELPTPPPGWFLLRLGGMLRQAASMVPGPLPGPWVPVAIAHQTHAYVSAHPDRLAELVQSRATTDIGVALMLAVPGHWRLMPGTVGQAAGASTISADRDRAGDTFW